MIVSHDGHNLRIDGVDYRLAYPIVESFECDGVVVVMFEPDSNPKNWGQFPNIVAVDRQGRQTWEASLPTSNTGDRYYKITSRDPLTAYSVMSYEVVLNLTNGRILTTTFFK